MQKSRSGTLISGRTLAQFVDSIAPGETLDAEAEALLLRVADGFLDSVAAASCKLASHRGAHEVEGVCIALRPLLRAG